MIFHQDEPGSVELVEEAGQIKSAKRLWKVTDVDGSTYGEAMSAVLKSDEVPKVQDSLSQEFAYCRLIRRVGTILGRNPQTQKLIVGLRLEYETMGWPIEDGETPEPTPQPGLSVGMVGSANLNQITTRRYRDDVLGIQPIDVSYTDPDDVTHTQVGELDVGEPRVTCQRVCLIRTDDAEAVAAFWVNKVNEKAWKKTATLTNGRLVLSPCLPECWLCTSVDPTLVDVTQRPHLYRFQFEFEYKDPIEIDAGPPAEYIGGYVQVAEYVGDDGRVPADVTWANGRRIVHWYEKRDFNLLFAY